MCENRINIQIWRLMFINIFLVQIEICCYNSSINKYSLREILRMYVNLAIVIYALRAKEKVAITDW